MFRKYSFAALILLTIMFGVKSYAYAQADQIERLWYNQEKTARIQIYKSADGKFYGKIVWLKVPTVDGKPKIDIHNPDEKKRDVPLLGLVILKDFKKDGADGYTDGTVYDPNGGKTYSCKITYEGDKLNVRGYYGFSWIGRTAIWTKAD
jgi:uncharacterized protein (DUF2147 family)